MKKLDFVLIIPVMLRAVKQMRKESIGTLLKYTWFLVVSAAFFIAIIMVIKG